MHELAICGSIAEIVTRRAGDRRVEAVHLRVGRLRQIVPDTLVYCWSLVIADTPLEGSLIDVEDVPARLHCAQCGTTSELGDLPMFACPACGSVEVEVVAGEEFLVTALDLADA